MKNCKKNISKLKVALENINLEVDCLIPFSPNANSIFDDIKGRCNKVISLLNEVKSYNCLEDYIIEISSKVFINVDKMKQFNDFIFLKQQCDYLTSKCNQILNNN
jgi:hypothetical protein